MQDNLARVRDVRYNFSDKAKNSSDSRTITKPKKKIKWRMMLTVSICFVLSMVALSQFSQINEMQKQTDGYQKQLFLMQASNKQRQLKIDQSMDLKTVEQIATTRLNMAKPAKNQIVYINVKNNDNAQIVKLETKKGFFPLLMQGVSNIMEYLN